MYDKFNRKRLNTQILAKTELALEAIKRHDMMQQSMLSFNISNFNASKTLLNQLDHDYSKLTPHKLIVLDHTYKISLLTYSQEFYSLEMMNCIFPMRVILKNVKNEATIFVGYDQQYPGIYQNNQMSIFTEESPTKKQKNYDFKSKVTQDMIIVLKNKGNKQIRNVYFTIVAGKSLFLSDFKVQFLGLARDRVQSEVKLKTQLKYDMAVQKKKIQTSMPTLQRTKTQSAESISKLKHFGMLKNPSRQNMSRTVKLQQLVVFNTELNKHNSKSNIEQNTFKRTGGNSIQLLKTKGLLFGDRDKGNSTGSFNTHKKVIKTEVDYKIEQAKRNKEMLEQYKIKDKELRQTASNCKKMIENYKKIFNQQNVRKKKLNKDIVLSLYSAIFLKHIYLITEEKAKKEKTTFRVNYMCLKFVKKMKNAYQDSCNMVPFRAKRLSNESRSGVYILSKMIAKQSTIRAQKVLKQTFFFLQPMLLVRHSISVSNKYRSNIKLIQRVWKQKYHNRLRSLLYFVDEHLQKMFKEFPHLKMFHQNFYSSKSNRAICLTYIKDQSEKYRFIYQAYMHKLQEINEMIVANLSVKKKLDIPRKPTRPMHRFYRNLDILKSMVRTWFEIEYKKYMKKSSKKLYF